MRQVRYGTLIFELARGTLVVHCRLISNFAIGEDQRPEDQSDERCEPKTRRNAISADETMAEIPSFGCGLRIRGLRNGFGGTKTRHDDPKSEFFSRLSPGPGHP